MTCGILHLASKLAGDALLDLAEVEAGHGHRADVRYVDRAVLGDALDAEIRSGRWIVGKMLPS